MASLNIVTSQAQSGPANSGNQPNLPISGGTEPEITEQSVSEDIAQITEYLNDLAEIETSGSLSELREAYIQLTALSGYFYEIYSVVKNAKGWNIQAGDVLKISFNIKDHASTVLESLIQHGDYSIALEIPNSDLYNFYFKRIATQDYEPAFFEYISDYVANTPLENIDPQAATNLWVLSYYGFMVTEASGQADYDLLNIMEKLDSIVFLADTPPIYRDDYTDFMKRVRNDLSQSTDGELDQSEDIDALAEGFRFSEGVTPHVIYQGEDVFDGYDSVVVSVFDGLQLPNGFEPKLLFLYVGNNTYTVIPVERAVKLARAADAEEMTFDEVLDQYPDGFSFQLQDGQVLSPDFIAQTLRDDSNPQMSRAIRASASLGLIDTAQRIVREAEVENGIFDARHEEPATLNDLIGVTSMAAGAYYLAQAMGGGGLAGAASSSYTSGFIAPSVTTTVHNLALEYGAAESTLSASQLELYSKIAVNPSAGQTNNKP